MCRLGRKGRGARHIPNGVSLQGYPFWMERGAGVISVQTLRAELLWVVAGVGHEDQGLRGPGTSSPPCPTAQINFCDALQHFSDSLLLFIQ